MDSEQVARCFILVLFHFCDISFDVFLVFFSTRFLVLFLDYVYCFFVKDVVGISNFFFVVLRQEICLRNLSCCFFLVFLVLFCGVLLPLLVSIDQSIPISVFSLAWTAW
jgi:hypothetical protein